jgi:hypothetical protein
MPIAADYPFLELVGTMAVFFLWVIWFWTLIIVLSDVFRRRDLSGGGKAGWTLFVIFLPFLGLLCYLIAHGDGLGERREADSRAALAARGYEPVTNGSPNGGAAAEIAKAKSLLDAGTITQAEFDGLKAKALA